MDEKIALQDRGTGIDTEQHRDQWAAAADVAAGIAAAGEAIVTDGFEFTDSDVDTGAGEATIPAGQAVLLDSDVSDGRTSMEWLRAAFPVRHPGGTVALATSGDTNVWLDAEPQATTPDQVSLVTGSTPSEPRLLLGTIAEDGTVTLQNRHRSPTFNELTAETVRAGSAEINEHTVSVQSDEPQNPDVGDVWVDNSEAYE